MVLLTISLQKDRKDCAAERQTTYKGEFIRLVFALSFNKNITFILIYERFTLTLHNRLYYLFLIIEKYDSFFQNSIKECDCD